VVPGFVVALNTPPMLTTFLTAIVNVEVLHCNNGSRRLSFDCGGYAAALDSGYYLRVSPAASHRFRALTRTGAKEERGKMPRLRAKAVSLPPQSKRGIGLFGVPWIGSIYQPRRPRRVVLPVPQRGYEAQPGVGRRHAERGEGLPRV